MNDSSISRSLSPRSPKRGRSYSPRSAKGSRSRSRSRSYSRHRSRSRSPPYQRQSYRGYYSRSPPPPPHRRSPVRRNFGRVYVSNLPFDIAWHELRDFMREAGQITQVDILKGPDGRVNGNGLVEYRYPEDAKRAIDILNNVTFMGRPVYIREDRDFGFSAPPKDIRNVPKDCRLSVSNLPPTASWQDVKDLFRRAGRVLHTDIYSDTGSRVPNGRGTVIFDEPRFVRNAIDMFDGYEWRGSKLVLNVGTYNRPPSVSAAVVDQESPQTTLPSSHQKEAVVVETMDPVHRYDMPQPVYNNNVSLVGGPAANLPTHGHNQIFVNNLPFSTTWQDLIDLFRHAGPVIRSEILTTNGYPKGSGFVRFEDASTCERAINKFNGYMYGGRQLDIQFDKFSTTI